MLNPFTERGRITNPEHFTGRFAELSLIFNELEHVRPVLLVGTPGIGVSSLLTHLAQSAAIALEEPTLRGFYLDLAGFADAAAVYRHVCQALQSRGENRAALDRVLEAVDVPVLLCLDNADTAAQAGWGDWLLDELARLSRTRALLLVASSKEPAPVLGERYTVVRLGAFAQAEIRLFTEAYLEVTDVRFTPAEHQELYTLSRGHPAYLQRAAYHLFRSRQEPGYRWRAAYLDEAATAPVPGAPLPPGIFEGELHTDGVQVYDAAGHLQPERPPPFAIPETGRLPFLVVGALLLVMVYVAWAILVQ